jgi:hypothetical protein
MTTYKIKLVSQTNAAVLIIALLAAFIGGIMIFAPHGVHDPISSWVIVGGSMIIAYILWQRFVTGRTEWTVTDNEIDINWSKKFSFANCEEIVLKWDEIRNISKGIDPHYYNLKIQLVSGQTIRFYHDYMTKSDDFDKCLMELYKRLQENRSK